MTSPSPFLSRLIPRLVQSRNIPRLTYHSVKFSTAHYPTTPTCPAPTCECAETPSLPEGCPKIDYEKPIRGHVPRYREQVLVCTGRDDWASNIETEDLDEVNMARELKRAFGRGGKFCDPFNPISIHNFSFDSRAPSPSSSLYLFPSFTYIPKFTSEDIPALAQTLGYPWMPPKHLTGDTTSASAAGEVATPEASPRKLQNPLLPLEKVPDITILICSHRGRDLRCGIYGPVLRDEFKNQLSRANIPIWGTAEYDPKSTRAARVGLISHIGGHAFAGNAIIYIPPTAITSDQKPHPLAGWGVWYGRVEPSHVEGIVKETILGGRIIDVLLRGGINGERNIF